MKMLPPAGRPLPSFFSLKIVLIVFLVAVCVSRVTHADDNDQEKDFCPDEVSVDLTYAESNDSGFQTDDGLFFPRGSARFRAGVWRGCICDVKPCIAFCPPWNLTSNKSSDVAKDYVKYSAIPRIDMKYSTYVDEGGAPRLENRFHIFNWNPCPGGPAYYLEPDKYEEDEFQILENGSLFSPYFDDSFSQSLDFRQYCLRQVDNNTVYTPRLCNPYEGSYEEPMNDILDKIRYVSGLVTVPFLIATVVVYSVLPELGNIHGKTLRCYLCCMILAYVALAADQIPAADSTAGTLRLCLGFTSYSSFVASFLWLKLMCFDTWWRFRSFGSSRIYSDRKKFVGYSIYAWGISAVMTAICISMEFSPGIPESMIRPGFRNRACWFETKEAAVLYFYGPIGVIIACNICLFISTSIKFFKHNKDMQRRLNSGESRRHNEKKPWFNLHLKLFIMMGVTWSTAIISPLFEGPEYLWVVTDLLTAFQGILIFVTLVCKENIWRSLKERYRHQMQICNCISRDAWSDLRAIAVHNELRISYSNFEEPSQEKTLDRSEVADGSRESYKQIPMTDLPPEESE